MGELTASIAHEINQPMSAILTNVDSAQVLLDSGRPDLAELRSIIADIRNDDLRASEIIRHIRNLANKREVEIAPFDMNQLVESSLRLAQPGARLRGVQIRSRCGRIPPARGDRIHAQQVLLNLMFNGMDAMAETPRGARTLLVTTALDPAGMIEVAVRDNGHGIAPEHAHRIFESFFTTKKDGMGLGLSIARSLIAAQGGRLSAANNEDRGATVSFTLPAEPGRAAPA
jgi:C4-dicarboxylate-specific signal transduction histidine kinase